ncbi:hypothetical protein TRFO_12061 [Tritrichomonas foetus]|uniref:USP domain-containing protein n=1 Tax=Tritrichomonas foetus TaxID=1144522 RepID=A0A1J4J5X7_9EUKA|nr:hypothetical protein TRFO_12061 [Tritrichomonas foetus]|eukprot:OHS93051.1 hypothetical protein TRFO_12061 [Tritrichomonas foetus]
MIEPEEDFQTWLLIAISTIETPDKFVSFLPQIENLIDSIIETNFLPESISNFTDLFIEQLNIEIERKVLALNYIPIQILDQFQEFFDKILDLGKYGVENSNQQAIKCAYTIIKNCQAAIYKISQSFSNIDVLESGFCNGLYKLAYDGIINGPEDISILYLQFQLCNEMYYNDENYDFIDFSTHVARACFKIAKEKPRSNTKTISKIINIINENARKVENTVDEDFCFPWIDLFVFFIRSNIFEKQLFAFKEIQNMLFDPLLSVYAIPYFQKPGSMDIFEMKSIHPEICFPVAQIIMKLAENDFVTDEMLTKLWNLHSVQHQSDLQKFFVIFSSVSTTLSNEQLPKLINQCINPKNENEEWVKFLGQLGNSVGERENTEKSFYLIRGKLFKIALNEDNPLHYTAQSVLPTIIHYHLNEDFFNTILKLFITNQDSVFMYNLLGSSFQTHQLKNKENAYKLLNKSLESLQYISDYSDISSMIFFVFNLIFYNNLVLTDLQLDILFLYRNEEDLIDLISRLMKSNLIPMNHLEELIMSLHPNEVNHQIFDLVRNIVLYFNKMEASKKFHSLPFSHEDLMWNMAMKDTPERHNFCTILCYFYLANDGTDLTDKEMMTTFIKRWNAEFKNILQSNSQPNKNFKNQSNGTFIDSNRIKHEFLDKNSAIFLLRTFINEIESHLDIDYFNVRRHNAISSNIPHVHVVVTGRSLPADQIYDIPENMLVCALQQRVSRISLIPINHFNLTINGRYIDKNLSLQTIMMNSGNPPSLHFIAQLIDPSHQIQSFHIRDCVPSQIIAQSEETVNLLINLLKENNDEAKMLLDYLPTDPNTLNQINQICRYRTFDFSSLIPRKFPSIFLYNLEAIISVYNNSFKDHFDKTGGFIYLIDSIPIIKSELMTKKIVEFLSIGMDDSIKLKNAHHILNSLSPYIVKVAQTIKNNTYYNNSYYNSFNSSSEFTDINEASEFDIFDVNESEFDTLSTFLTSIFSINGINISVDEELFSSFIAPLLLNPNELVRNSTISMTQHLTIPLDDFLKLIPNVTHKISQTFYYAVLPHVNKSSTELIEVIKKNMVSPIHSLLSILDKMLENGFVDKKDEAFFTKMLIDRYLCIDSRDKNKGCFDLAIKCLSKMRNILLLRHLQNLHKGKTQYYDWNIDGDSNIVSPTGHCGLINLGATCFLNSTLQQFFAIPLLRNKILEYKGNDDFMCSLRTLYAQMYLSKGQLQTTEDLVRVWTGWDGEPMNPMIQQDACEFTQMLIDKLEGGLTPQFINSLFGGTTVNIFEGLSEEFSAESVQPFSTFTLPIQGCFNTDDAFAQVQTPDFFTGENQYFAENLGHKIDVKKVEYLCKLPPYLIIQLSRFEYNYDLGIRTKINSIFHFPSQIDVSDFTSPLNKSKQEMNYVLRGVIMHHGSADFGHYTSYIKDRITNKWFLYNDMMVTEVTEEEVLENGSGSRMHHSSAYILFYDRIDTQIDISSSEPIIPQKLVNKIHEENVKHDEYRLFCSEPYFEFMRLLAMNGEPQFTAISLYYYFDTFPFTLHIKRAKEIAPLICHKLLESQDLRDLFINFLVEGPFSCSLAYCPTADVRNGAVNMIKSIDSNSIPIEFFDHLIDLIPTILPYYQVFDQTFQLIEHLVTNSPKLLNYAITNHLSHHLMNMIIFEMPRYIAEREMTPICFFAGINLSGVFSLIKHFKVSPNFIDFILNDTFLQNILRSKTSISSFVNMLKSFSDQAQVFTIIKNFTEKHGIYIRYNKITELLFDLFEEDAFQIINSCHFMIDQRSCNNFDLICSISYLIHRQHKTQFFLRHIDKWLIQMLIDDIPECRVSAEHAASFLVPHKTFMNLPQFPPHDYYPQLGLTNMEVIDLNNDESHPNATVHNTTNNSLIDSKTMLKNAEIILKFLITNAEVFIHKINQTNDCIGYQWIDLVDKLSEITNIDISDNLIYIVKELIPYKKLYDENLGRLYIAIRRNGNEKIDPNLVLDFFPQSFEMSIRQGQKITSSRILSFFEAMNDSIDILQNDIPDSFITDFMKTFCFPRNPVLISHYQILASYLWRFSIRKPEIVYQCIYDNLHRFASTYLSGVLVALEAMPHKKLPLLDYLWNACNSKQLFSMNEVVFRTFKSNAGCVDDIYPLISLLNSPNLLNDGRYYIWSLIYFVNPPFEQFIDVYKWKGDWAYLAKYVAQCNYDSSNETILDQIKQIAVEASQKSLEAFDYLFDILYKFDCQTFTSFNFINLIFERVFERPKIIIKYIQFFNEKNILNLNNPTNLTEDSLLKHLISMLKTKVEFIENLVKDHNGVNPNDIKPIAGTFEVLSVFPNLRELYLSDVETMKKLVLSPEVEETINSAKLQYIYEVLSRFN